MWHGFPVVDLKVSDILQQHAEWCLDKLENPELSDPWTAHLYSLETCHDLVVEYGWNNPIVVWEASPEEFAESPSYSGYTGQKYLPAIGWNRLYWSNQWKMETISAIVADNKMEAHSLRTLMEADKRVFQFGVERVNENFIIPKEKLEQYDIYSVRHPQWILPKFRIKSDRIVERIKGEWVKATGKYNVVRPMPGARTTTSCFYLIAGQPPTEKYYETVFIPEGWIGPETDEEKYRKLFREWV